MSKITVAKTAGFCFGVDRAVNLVYELLGQGKKVCTLGPIIHNPQLVNELSERGVIIADSVNDVPVGYTVVIRSHGVDCTVYDALETRHLDYCDATCPFVEKIHKIADNNTSPEVPLFIAGDKNHAEVIGIMGHAHGNVYSFNDIDELQSMLQKANILEDSAFCVVAQTTFNKKKWEKCEIFLKKHYTNAKIFGTICSATSLRQNEADELSKNCDLMIVVGGRYSSNTAKLYDICSKNCKTLLIETADELNSDDIISANRIGLTAGASTPAVIIKEVLTTMSDTIKNEGIQAEESVVDTVAASESANAQDCAKENITEAKETAAEAVKAKPVEKSFDEMTFEEAFEASLSNMNHNKNVKGTVIAVNQTEVQVDIGRKQTGIIPASELSDDSSASPADLVKVGDVLDLVVIKTDDSAGITTLSKKRLDANKGFVKIQEAFDSQEIVTAKVTAVVKGGVTAVANGVRIFVPASQATLSRNDDLNALVGTEADLRIIDIRRGRSSVVGSIRSVLKERKAEQEKQIWDSIEVGKHYTGTVKSLTSYGAFVDIGGVDGMVHITELSWLRIKHPSEVVKVGDTVDVYVKDFDAEKHRISLGYKKTEDDPWEILKSKYTIGDTVSVKVVSFATYGAFANVIPGIDGLIHISQIANKHIEKPQDVLSVGDEVEAKITDIDYDKKRVSLSIRALLPEEPVAAPADEPIDEMPEIISTDDAESIAKAAEVIAAQEDAASEE